MRFLFFTDLHAQAATPRNRNGNWPEDVVTKLQGIGKIIKRYGVDIALFGGDMFNHRDVGFDTIDLVMDEIEAWKIPILAIVGSHDLHGRNMKSLSKTAIGHAARRSHGHLHIVRDGKSVDGYGIIPVHDDGSAEDLLLEEREGKNAIVLIHATVTKSPWIVQGKNLSIQPSAIRYVNKGDIALLGHYHPCQGVWNNSGITWVSPGAVARMAATESDMSRVPQVAIFDHDGTKHGKVMLLKIPGARDEVFDRHEIDEEKSRDSEIKKLVENLGSTGGHLGIDPVRVVKTVGKKEGLSKRIIKRALLAIEEASQNE